MLFLCVRVRQPSQPFRLRYDESSGTFSHEFIRTSHCSVCLFVSTCIGLLCTKIDCWSVEAGGYTFRSHYGLIDAIRMLVSPRPLVTQLSHGTQILNWDLRPLCSVSREWLAPLVRIVRSHGQSLTHRPFLSSSTRKHIYNKYYNNTGAQINTQ